MPDRHSDSNPGDVLSCTDRGAPPTKTYRDLCSTCIHVKTCGTRSTPQHPILFCEEFDAFTALSASASAKTVSQDPPATQGGAKHKGLCVNCENRETCTMRKGEGGVWHCEEYR